MKPAILDLRISKGITFGPVQIYCQDEDLAPVDITGWQVFAQVRRNPNGDVLFDLLPVITDGPAGEITLSADHEDTAELQAGLYRWDLILENPDGERLGPFIVGAVHVLAPITQT
jgi:hypothetical protein